MSNSATVEIKGKNDPLKRVLDDSRSMIGGFGSHVVGTFAAIGAAATAAFGTQQILNFAKESIVAASGAEDALASFRGVTIATGNSAKFTEQQLGDLATEMQLLTKFEDDNVVAAAGVLSIYQNISGDAFPRAIRLAADMSSLFGGDLTSAVRGVGRALDSPKEGMAQLSKQGLRLDADIVALVESLVDAGKEAEAQGILFDALESKFQGLAITAGETASGGLEQLKNRFGDLQEQVGGGLIPVLQQLAPLAETTVSTFGIMLETMSNTDGIERTTGALSDLEAQLSGAVVMAANFVDTMKAVAGLREDSATAKFLKWGTTPIGEDFDNTAEENKNFGQVFVDTMINQTKEAEAAVANQLSSVQEQIRLQRAEREEAKKDAQERLQQAREASQKAKEDREKELELAAENAPETGGFNLDEALKNNKEFLREHERTEEKLLKEKEQQEKEARDFLRKENENAERLAKEVAEAEKKKAEDEKHTAQFEGLEDLHSRIQAAAASQTVEEKLVEANEQLADVGLKLFDQQAIMTETLTALDDSITNDLTAALETMAAEDTADAQMDKQNTLLTGIADIMAQDKVLSQKVVDTNEKIAASIPEIGKME